LWLFREKIREKRFAELGLTKPTSVKLSDGGYNLDSGLIEVFRRVKLASEPFTNPAAADRDLDAAYLWGTDRDPEKDEAVLRGPNGSAIRVFDFSDDWQIPDEEQQRVEEEKKIVDRCTAADPMAKFGADMVLGLWETGSSTSKYWVANTESKRLFTVKSRTSLERYNVADNKFLDGRKPNSSMYLYRIESTSQGGFPITRDWYIYVTLSDDQCKVYDITAAN
jgi:hypothetical protein